MAHNEPPHQDLYCLQIQPFSSLVVKELSLFSASLLALCLYFNYKCHSLERELLFVHVCVFVRSIGLHVHVNTSVRAFVCLYVFFRSFGLNVACNNLSAISRLFLVMTRGA